MTAKGFLLTANEHFQIGHAWLLKLVAGLRRFELLPGTGDKLYPDTREKGAKAHVGAKQAAHLIRLMAMNINPRLDDFEEKVLQYKQLVNDKDFFINDLADMLWNGNFDRDAGETGEGENKKILVDRFHRISFSLDRPFVAIVWRRHECYYNEEGIPVQDDGYVEVETVYGDGREGKPFERFAIVKRSVFHDLSAALSRTGYDKEGDDQNKASEVLEHIHTH